jgi:flavodoxin
MDYKNGKIYKIVCNTTGLQYIGSTCNPYLSTRLAQHRSDYKKHLQNKTRYISSIEVLKNDNYEIILIESCPFETKDQLHARERFYIENNDCVNKVKNVGLIKELGSFEYNKQYRAANNEKIAENIKQYRAANKEKIAENRKDYRATNKEKTTEYNKQYRATNKEKIAEYNKKRYQFRNNQEI